jgi:uncharacterized protein (TIGR02453 family)
MAKEKPFVLPKGALTFLSGLEKNNNKAWFTAHKSDYDEYLLEPLKFLVMGMGAAFSKKLPGLNYNPKINGSIFRIYRDVRFSKDKRPYKTNAGVFLWAGPAKKLACPGIYFHLEAKSVMLGSGIYMISKESLDRYRKHVSRKGAALAKAIAKAEKAGFEVGGERLKRVPSGFDPDHKYAELLKMKGLWVGKTYPSSKVTRGDLIGWLKKEYAPTLDVVKALGKAVF